MQYRVSPITNRTLGVTLATTVAMAAAAGPARAAEKAKLVPWQLVEAADARSFWIAPTDSKLRYCNDLRVVRTSLAATRVRIQLEATPDPNGPMGSCEVPSDVEAPERLRVRVAGGIEGRRIGGPKQDRGVILPFWWSAWHPRSRTESGEQPPEDLIAAPRLIGLSSVDARQLTKRLGLTNALLVEGSAGEVVDQSPAPGTAIDPAAATVTVTTR